jgi:hypothetical protein
MTPDKIRNRRNITGGNRPIARTAVTIIARAMSIAIKYIEAVNMPDI